LSPLHELIATLVVRCREGDHLYRPLAGDRDRRIVVIWKDLGSQTGRRKLFDDVRCLFSGPNDFEKSAEEIVFAGDHRCDQENLFTQLREALHSFSAPVDSLLSNWASSVTASLVWSLQAWMAFSRPETGRDAAHRRTEKDKLPRMEFTTFRRALMVIPAQIISTGRRIVFRLLAWNPGQELFFRMLDQLRLPLRW
jgi:hypothetical protein